MFGNALVMVRPSSDAVCLGQGGLKERRKRIADVGSMRLPGYDGLASKLSSVSGASLSKLNYLEVQLLYE